MKSRDDKYIGKAGSKELQDYKYELRMDVLGKMIKAARIERGLTRILTRQKGWSAKNSDFHT